MVGAGRAVLALLVVLCLAHADATARGSELGDIFYARKEGADEFAPAYFPHWVHRLRYKCYACHDDLFPMRRGFNPTMKAMARGESCGACHNGKVAFGVDTCQRCHVGR